MPINRGPPRLLPLLRPYADKTMEAFPVSVEVNGTANEAPSCTMPTGRAAGPA